MDDLILRSLLGRATAAEAQRLFEWRRASDANERAYQELARVWTLSGKLRTPSADDDSAPTIEQLIKERRTRPAVIGLPSAPAPRRGFRRAWPAAVAAIAALLAIVVSARLFWLGGPHDGPVTPIEVATGAGELSTVTLADGTVVRLAPSSRLRLPRGAAARDAWLDGRAYFAVAPDPDRRFRVRTGQGDAVVIGTRFDLHATDRALRLLVVEGVVELQSGGDAVAVAERRLAEVRDRGEPAVGEVDEDYIRRTLDWTGNFIAFESTPLHLAARELSQHYGMPVTVLDSALAEETVSGWFTDEGFEHVLMMLCRTVRAHCAVRADGATIAP